MSALSFCLQTLFADAPSNFHHPVSIILADGYHISWYVATFIIISMDAGCFMFYNLQGVGKVAGVGEGGGRIVDAILHLAVLMIPIFTSSS